MNILKTLWKIAVVNHKTTIAGWFVAAVNTGYDYIARNGASWKTIIISLGLGALGSLAKDGDAPSVQQPKL